MMTDTGMNPIQARNLKLYEGVGCDKCNNSWYLGRLWIYEIVSLDEELRKLIRSGASVEDIIREARKEDLITMKEDGILKALGGFTTIEEILRVV
jgi:type IV pilus assembly protein PilB